MYRSENDGSHGNYFRRGGTTDSRETHKGSRTPHQEVRRRTRMEILNGRYGPYIAYKGNNYKIPKDIVPQDLSLHSCMELIRIQDEKRCYLQHQKEICKKK